MTDYTLITGIERGHNAFTSTAKSKLITPRENAALARGTKQTRKIEKLRSEGIDVGALHGISTKSDERIRQRRANAFNTPAKGILSARDYRKTDLKASAERVNPNSCVAYTDRAGQDKNNAIRGR